MAGQGKVAIKADAPNASVEAAFVGIEPTPKNRLH
jgi:hypothetical protein